MAVDTSAQSSAPTTPSTPTRVTSVLAGRVRAARRTFRSAVASALLNPLLYLLAMGLGIGAVADPGQAAALPGGSYLAFLAPGLLVATAMQLAASESLWPVMVGLEWRRTYHAIVATPVRPVDLVLGNLAFIVLRAGAAGLLIGVVIVALGAAPPLGTLVAVGAGMLVAAAFTGLVTAFTARVRNHQAMTALLRFGIVPLFLFSGTFFPIDRLPAALQAVAPLSPLWHGAELARLAALGTDPAWPAAGHLAVLVGLAVLGAALAERKIRELLTR